MDGQFAGQVALVTGAASGIGRAAAQAFAAAGARVVIADVDRPGAEETARFIADAGGEAIVVDCDVSRAADAEGAVQAAVATWGRLDCAFNNAGIEGVFARTADYEEADWARALAVNLTGIWLCMKYEIRQMLTQGGGAIVNTASTEGLIGAPRMPAYAASKHGVIGLTKSAALEYARRGIRVNAVCPGYTQTAMIDRWTAERPWLRESMLAGEPVGRPADPAEIAAAALWLCSAAASFVTGVALPVDGGVIAS
jgi:NAD(P)-dependent dehydrogenase (short-subunit alcohol dehydrogenase family)